MRQLSNTYLAGFRSCLLAATAMLCVAGATTPTAHAQGYTPIYTLDFGNPTVLGDDGVQVRGSGRRFALATAYFPLVAFYRSGFFPETNTSGTNDITGRLVAVDGSFVTGNINRPAIDVGGWYFAEGSTFESKRSNQADLYQLHGRVYATGRREIGFQASILKSTTRGTSGEQYTFMAVSEYSSRRIRRRSKSPGFALQGGIGAFVDPNYDPEYGGKRTTTGATLFASGSLEISPRFSVTVSEWYVRSRRQDINRLAVGIGYAF